MKIILDAMGGDLAPEAPVLGAIEAAKTYGTEITLVGNCMISTHLAQGEHTIQLRYQNKAFALGWKISLLSVAVFGTCAYLAYKPELEKRKTNKG